MNPTPERPAANTHSRSLGPASSIPQTKQRRILRGGEAEPSDWRYWFARAHIAWTRRNAPHLLQDWNRR